MSCTTGVQFWDLVDGTEWNKFKILRPQTKFQTDTKHHTMMVGALATILAYISSTQFGNGVSWHGIPIKSWARDSTDQSGEAFSVAEKKDTFQTER
jgi:hypothetical protein